MFTNKVQFRRLVLIVSITLSLYAKAQTNLTPPVKPDTLIFQSDGLSLKALLWTPAGEGPFPVLLFHHGNGAAIERAFDSLAPVFLKHGYAFFAPSRRGQNLSRGIGRPSYMALDSAMNIGGAEARTKLFIQLNETEQLNDGLAAMACLKKQSNIDTNRISVAGVSVGGILSLLMAENNNVCAAIDFAGGAMNWDKSALIQSWMKERIPKVKVPVYFIQAENDVSTNPSKELSKEMQRLNKPYRMKIFPSVGKDNTDGHMFGYFNSAIWENDVFQFLKDYCK